MHYHFPHDITLDEVKAIVAKNPNFYIGERDGYLVVNYLVAGKETHPPVVDRETSVMRELRGLMFDHDGKLISRRLHKFFNLGEREDVAQIDVSKPHTVLEKLDGSMITPVLINGELRWCTKMGVTEVAGPVEEFVSTRPNYAKFAMSMIMSDMTPIFEWCSRKQRIVIDYPEDRLVLIAIRYNSHGQYVNLLLEDSLAIYYDIPIVDAMSPISDLDKFTEELRKREDIEGVVIRFDDGHMVKVKTDTYIALHRAKSLLENERDVVGLILENKFDDLAALLPQEDKIELYQYADNINHKIGLFCLEVDHALNHMYMNRISRKDFAIGKFNTVTDAHRTFIFKHWDEQKLVYDRGYSNVRESVHDFILKHLGSNRSFEKVIPIIMIRWKEKKIND